MKSLPKRLAGRLGLAGLALVLAGQAAGQQPVPSELAAGNFRSGGGFSFRADFTQGWTVLNHNTPLLPLETYRGATGAVFTVVLADGRAPKPTLQGAWDHQRAEYALEPGRGCLTVSRLSPAVLVESDRPSLALRSAPAPKYAAFVRAGKCVVLPAEGLAAAAGGTDLDEPWMLLWFGQAAPLRGWAEPFDVEGELGVSKSFFGRTPPAVDLPVLVRLEHRPASIRADGDKGLTLTFAKAAGKLAIMPLLGGKILLPAETEKWSGGLPQDVLAQCRAWSARLRDFPLTVRETFTADAAAGAVTIRQEFQWASFADDWQSPPTKAAPVPPMLAVALGAGADVRFLRDGREVKPVDCGLMDTPGKAMAIEGAEAYEYRIGALRELVDRPARAGGAAPASEASRQKLQRHVAEMVQAGHLAPLLYIYGGIGGTWFSHFYWGRSAELATALAEAHPFLPRELQSATVEYLRNEWKQHPALRFDRGRYASGKPRMPYELPSEDMERQLTYALSREEAYRTRDFFFELYGLEAYLALTGDPPPAGLRDEAAKLAGPFLARQDWAILGPSRLAEARDRHSVFYYNLQGAATYNRYLAGAIGLTRLARRCGWKDLEPLGWYLVGKLAMARVGQARYVAALHEAGCVRGGLKDDNRALLHVDTTCAVVGRGPLEMGVHQNQELPPFYDLTEEVGRLLGRCARDECRLYLDHLDRSVPLWWISEAPKQGATEQRTCPLQHYGGNVLAQYWVLGKTGDALARYVDTTRFVGDLYVIRNLAALVESCGASDAAK